MPTCPLPPLLHHYTHSPSRTPCTRTATDRTSSSPTKTVSPHSSYSSLHHPHSELQPLTLVDQGTLVPRETLHLVPLVTGLPPPPATCQEPAHILKCPIVKLRCLMYRLPMTVYRKPISSFPDSLIPAFHSLVDSSAGPSACWPWRGPLNSLGYPRFDRGSRFRGYAHRVAYFLTHRLPMPPELELDHTCRNRACCNPNHLQPVSHSQNIRRGLAARTPRQPPSHCKRGHPFSPDNIIHPRPSARACRSCWKAASKAWRSKKLAADPSYEARMRRALRKKHRNSLQGAHCAPT